LRRRSFVVTKTVAQRAHARRRALERYGIVLNKEARRAMVEAVRSGRARLVHRRSNRVATYEIEWEGRTVLLSYDRKRGTIVTFLPPRKGGLGAAAAPQEVR